MKKYQIECMTYEVTEKEGLPGYEYRESMKDSISIDTDELKEAVDTYYKLIERYKDTPVTISLGLEYTEIEYFSTLDPALKIRI